MPPPPTVSPQDRETADGSAASHSSHAGPPKGPGHIGHYHILEKIGEGNTGTVYRAERVDGTTREVVALKVVKLGVGAREVVARFESERPALAAMDHPGVARVFDAGVTESGRAFFVSEFAPGVPVTRYCDEQRLGLRKRIELFLHVCPAVQHGHQKGVIHRDLRPANILVGDGGPDGSPPRPRVLDFGVAAALHPSLPHHGSGLRTGAASAAAKAAVVAYRSPEQAAARAIDAGPIDVDTRADVYALGAVLYELLCGAPPFDPRALRDASMEGMARLIREGRPAAPSRRVLSAASPDATRATAADLAAAAAMNEAAQARGAADARALARRLAGDLDAVVMKAIAHDRAARYDTVNELADDLRRYLRGEPVAARAAAGTPGGRRYRAGRWARRHWAGLTGAAAGVLLLAGVVAAGALLWSRAADERRDLEYKIFRVIARDSMLENRIIQNVGQRAEAERRAAVVTQASDYLQAAFASARWSAPAGGRAARVADVLDRAAAGASREFARQPDVEIWLRLTLALRYRALGLDAEALANLRRAHDLARRVQQERTEPALLVEAELALAEASPASRRPEVAERVAREALAAAKGRFGEWHRVTRRAKAVLATVLTGPAGLGGADREAEAEALYRELTAHARDSADPSEHDPATFNQFGRLMQARRQYAEAESLYREALEMAREAPPSLPAATAPAAANAEDADVLAPLTTRPTTLPSVTFAAGEPEEASEATIRLNLAAVLEAQDRPDEAAAEYRAVLRDASANLGALHPANQLAAARLAALLRTAGKADDAREVFRDHQQAAWVAAVAQPAFDGADYKRRADFRARLGQFPQAADDYAAATARDPSEHWAWYYRACVLAYLARATDDPAEAGRWADHYRQHRQAMLERFAEANDPGVADRTAKAAALLPPPPPTEGSSGADAWSQPLALSDRALSADPRFRGWFLLGRGLLLYRTGQFDKAIEALDECRPGLPPVHTPHQTALATADLIEAMARHRLGQVDEARRLLGEARRRIASEVPRLDEADIGASGLDNWWVCQTLLREADALISAKNVATQTPAARP